MPDGKSGPCMSGSTFLRAEMLNAPDVHPRFISRIQRVLFEKEEKEESARMRLIKTYCLLKKLTNQLHIYEEAFDRAQYKLLADKCEALCRSARAAATNDRPQLSQVLSLREEVIDLRSIIAAAMPGTYQDASARSAQPSTSPDDTGQGVDASSGDRSNPLADTECLVKKKLTSKNEPAPKLASGIAISQRSLTGRLSS